MKKYVLIAGLIGTYKPPEPTRYIGAPNAFLLELFAMHQDYDERSLSMTLFAFS